MYVECENWTIKKAEFQRIGAFELWYWRRLESPLDCKEVKPVNPKGNQPWVFIRTDAESEVPILWPPDGKSCLIGKAPDAGKDQRQKEKRAAEDEMVWWHHWLHGHGFGCTPGVGDGQRRLECCCLWVAKSDTTEWLNWLTMLSVSRPSQQRKNINCMYNNPCRHYYIYFPLSMYDKIT